MKLKQVWNVTSFADVLQLVLGILTLVILFTGMFMVFSFSKFYPWYLTKGSFSLLWFLYISDFVMESVTSTMVLSAGFCTQEFERNGLQVGLINSDSGHGHNMTKADCMQM